jgi:hypothetical protein
MDFSPPFQEVFGRELSSRAEEVPLLAMLETALREVLNEPGDRIWQILYRLDVPEVPVRNAMAGNPPEEWPRIFAGLVLEREKKRQFWRQTYAGKKNLPGTDDSGNPAS